MYYWDLFREMNTLKREMEKIMSGERALPQTYSTVSFLPGLAAHRYPLVNIFQDDNALYVKALAPGIDPENLSVTVSNDQLTIEGEKLKACGDVQENAYHRCERAAGKFVRRMDLPIPVDSEKIEAEYKNGLLMITLPKAEAAKPRQISVKVE